ncbi:hypothetical protein [Pseudactinotalea terrae]|uniref:hypothetical protein n=1 Tax=Pseudactinotalea terrae TaxID=1743262 RepID=UPI0012E18D9E|nr:hypothetical protein [Pseudactinotalea terrae]
MSGAEVALIAIGVLAIVGVVLVNLAQRIDRLHRRVISSRSVLEGQLVKRAEAAAELARTDALDPASTLIVGEAAWNAAVQAPRLVSGTSDLAQTGAERGLVESELTMALRAALGDEEDLEALRGRPETAAALEGLEQACYRTQLARRFHNDAVVATQRLRQNPVVPLLRLAGRAAMPATFEMDDEVFRGTPSG